MKALKIFLFILLISGFINLQEIIYADETGELTQKINKKGNISELVLNWTTSNSGNFERKIREINGLILIYITDPGSPAPDDNYDILLIDSYGLRIDGDSGAGETVAGNGILNNHDTANTEYRHHTLMLPSIGGMSLFVFNAGKSKQGKLIIRYLEETDIISYSLYDVIYY